MSNKSFEEYADQEELYMNTYNEFNEILESNIHVKQILKVAKNVLTEKEFSILVDRTFTSVTLKSLASDYGVTQVRIRQIYLKAIKKIKLSNLLTVV